MSVQMRLGWWRDRGGNEHKVDLKYHRGEWFWESSDSDRAWRDDGSWDLIRAQHPYDLIEFIRPLDTELPPTLNAAVKAAEDRVRDLKQMVDESQAAWATACRLHEAARKELERLEKECEVKQ